MTNMKRSNAPIFWLLFGAGGMLSALVGAMLVYITGVAVALGWPPGPSVLSYQHILAFAQNGLGKCFLFAVVALFAWHAVHRIFHSMHDFGVHTGTVAKLVCYGTAFAISVISGVALLSIGF